MLIENTRRVIKDVASLPATGQSNSIYHNTTDGFFYYWNDVTGEYIKLEPLDALTTVQPTPTATGNTANLNKVFKDANGSTWFVDSNGDAILMGSAVFKEQNRFYVDPNGLDANNGANESPKLTVQAAVAALAAGDIAIVNEGVYSDTVTLSVQNTSMSGADGAVNSLTQIGALAVTTASGTSNKVSDLTVLGAVTHSGGAPLYLHSVTVNGNYVSTSAAYEEINDCRMQDGTITKTTAGTIYIKDSLIGNATFNTPNTVVSLDNVSIDVGEILTIGAGVIYMLNDVRGHVVIDPAAIPLNTVAVAQGLSGLAAKSTETASFNDIRLTNVPTITTATKALVRDSNGVVSEQTIPAGGALWYSGTATPSATGNTAAGLGIASLPANYTNTTTGVVYYIDANGVARPIEGRVTTSLLGRNGSGGAYVNPTMASDTKLVDAFQLSDGTFAHVGQIKYPAHGLVKHAYYFGSATSPYFTVVPPTNGILQQVFYVIDENTIDIDIEQGVAIDLADYANVVYVNNVDVNNGTIYDTANPPVTNNNALKGDQANIYIGSDGSLWIWNGTSYVTKPATNNTEWYLGATQVDAQGNKTGSISRNGWVFIGANKNATCPLDLENNAPGTAFMNVARYIATNQNVAGRSTMFTMGANQSAGNIADWRFYYAGPASGNNRSDFGFSGNVSPNITMLYGGLNGVGTVTPVSKLEVAGSFGATVRGINASTTTSNDFTVLMNTSGITLTLEAPGPLLRRIMNVKNTTTGTVTVTGHIDGVAGVTLTLAAKASRTFQSNGNSWFILSGYL